MWGVVVHHQCQPVTDEPTPTVCVCVWSLSNNWWKLGPACCHCWNCFPAPQLRKAVSQNKLRYKGDGFNLDLTRLTPRIIIFGTPTPQATVHHHHHHCTLTRLLLLGGCCLQAGLLLVWSTATATLAVKWCASSRRITEGTTLSTTFAARQAACTTLPSLRVRPATLASSLAPSSHLFILCVWVCV